MIRAAITATMAMVVASSRAVIPALFRFISISSGRIEIQILCHKMGWPGQSDSFPMRINGRPVSSFAKKML
jgi:hypothetical protein